MDNIGLEVNSEVATITLRRPPDNRFDRPMVEEFDKALDEVVSRNARALVLAGDGPDFCHGGDIVPWEHLQPVEWAAQLEGFAYVFNRLEHISIPVVAAVQGLCNGGGFELVLRADLIFAGTHPRFSHSEQSLGLVAALGGIYRSAQRVGPLLAYEWALTSEEIPAEVLYRYGGVNRLIDEADLALARIPRPCGSCCMFVLVDDAPEVVAFSYVEAGDLLRIRDRRRQGM